MPGAVRSRVQQSATAAAALRHAGLLRPARPDRLLGQLLAVARYRLSLAAGYAAAAARAPAAVALIDDDGPLTFAAVVERGRSLAAAYAAAGVSDASVVGVLARNGRSPIEALVATSLLGADAVLLNTGLAAPALRDVCVREQVSHLATDPEFHTVVPRYLPVLPAAGSTGSGHVPARPPRVGRLVILTSGTTGTPKGAHRGDTTAEPLTALLSAIPYRARQTTVLAAPTFHAWGLGNLGLAVVLGSTVVLRRRFDAEQVLADVALHRASTLVAVPVMLQRMVELPPAVRARHDLNCLRVVAVSGSALPAGLAERFMDAYGEVIYNLYGSTEVAYATVAGPPDLRAAAGTAGRVLPGVTVRLLDDSGRDVEPGAVGRIFVGNAMGFDGYTGGGDKERLDGLVATGDRGCFDAAGRLFIRGRDDDMIVSGGENVFPAEVEDVLGRHPAVAEVAVAGVLDPRFGQALVAWVVPVAGHRGAADPEALRTHVRAQLGAFKVPREIHVIDALPRTDTGKVRRTELVARLSASAAATGVPAASDPAGGDPAGGAASQR